MDQKKTHRILVAEDNDDDFLLVRDAFEENRLPVDLHWVKDGEELLEYLHHRDRYEAPGAAPEPGLILLDLNMPKKNGFEALQEIKADRALRRLPVIAFSTSASARDVDRVYELGINAYVRKPIGFVLFAEAMKTIYDFWFGLAQHATGNDR